MYTDDTTLFCNIDSIHEANRQTSMPLLYDHLSHQHKTLQNIKTALSIVTGCTLDIQHMHDKINILPLQTHTRNYMH